MANKHETPRAGGPARKRRLSCAATKGSRIVRTLARSTLLAAGFAVSQLGIPEIDSRFQVFDPTLVDRLHAPITRYHE
jgi:hypothetical protein